MKEAIEKMIKDRVKAFREGRIVDANSIEQELKRFNVILTDTNEGTSYRLSGVEK